MKNIWPTVKFNKAQIQLIDLLYLINQNNQSINNISNKLKDKIFAHYKFDLDIIFNKVSMANQSINNDEIVIHFLDTQKQENIFAICNTILARQLLSHLLATSLFDNFDGLLFSTTEKGLFSFICARLLYDLRRDFSKNIQFLKIIEIFNKNDQKLNSFDMSNYFSLNFIIKEKNQDSVLNLILSRAMLIENFPRNLPINNSNYYQTIINDFMRINISTLLMTLKQINDLALFDVILLGKKKHQNFAVNLHWKNLNGLGEVFIDDGCYKLRIIKNPGFAMTQEIHQENLNGVIEDLAINIEVQIANHKILLKELLMLHEGSIINLEIPIDSPLKLILNQKVIGMAEAVDVDGQFGLRIISLNHHAQ